MAHLVKDYNFGFPLKNVQQLDAIEQNILTDDKYATSLVNYSLAFRINLNAIRCTCICRHLIIKLILYSLLMNNISH